MKIDINTPEIATLCDAVEKRFGVPARTPRHFVLLASEIENKTDSYLSETTLQRVWKYKTGYKTIAIHTLNVLCHYIGKSDWEAFCRSLNDDPEVESEMFTNDSVDIDGLSVGDKIKIGWKPNRYCIVEYLGNHRFKAIETFNAKLSPGDSFSCHKMQVGCEWRLEHVVRNESDMSYVAGSRTGLTSLEIIKK